MWGKAEIHTKPLSEDLNDGGHLVDIGLNGRTILKWALTLEAMNVDWIHLAPDTVQWQTCVKTLLNPQFL